jgi:hypothetical protein
MLKNQDMKIDRTAICKNMKKIANHRAKKAG